MKRRIKVYCCIPFFVIISACTVNSNVASSSLDTHSDELDQNFSLVDSNEDTSKSSYEFRIYPYGSDSDNLDYPLEEYNMELDLISESLVSENVFKTETTAIISLYANELYWNDAGELVPSQDASVFILVAKLDGNEYILEWCYIQLGVIDYKVFETDKGLVITVIYDTQSHYNVDNYYFTDGYFYLETACDIEGQKIAEGGVHYAINS